jgi:integrase
MAELRRHTDVASKALEFTILTASRQGEVTDATVSEFDIENRVWTVPGARMKSGREHRVPLTPRALEIVSELAANAKPSALLFPGARRGRLLSDLRTVLKRMGRSDIVPHGFRATFKTWASEQTNAARETIEAALAHVSGDRLEDAYMRSDRLEPRRLLMSSWAAYADGTNATDNVVVQMTKQVL